MKNFIGIAILSWTIGCAQTPQKSDSVTILPVEKVNWQKLNPARGDKSPQAGTLWGDRKGSPATGFLAKFVDGFSSPPHIHNVSYRAIVIEGLVHNDDPSAETMWMPNGSYWTQPAGEPHITSAKGKSNIALVEIDNGPYLVKPIGKKFDNGERPYNIHASNIIWRDQGKYQIVELWKNSQGKVGGSLIKFGGNLNLSSKNSQLVLIRGQVSVQNQVLNPGSLVSTQEQSVVSLSCPSKDCVLYVKTDEKFRAF